MNWNILIGFLVGLSIGLLVFVAFLIHKINAEIEKLLKMLRGEKQE